MNGNESGSFGRALRALSGLVAAFAVGVVVAGAAPAAPPGGHGPPGGGGHDEATEEYVAPASLYRVGAEGTDATRLTQGPGYNAWSDNNASVRSDGAIVFASTRPAADETVDAELWLLLPDGSLVQLTDNASAVSDETGEEEPINDVNPVFSPDGTMVAYQSAPVAVEGGSQAGSQIWVLDVATKTPEQVTTFQASVGAAKHPTWSPDGTQLAFTVGDGRQMHIVRIDLATKALTDVTPRGSTDSMPAWSPTDADLIAYTRGMGSTMDVRLKNIATGAETVAAGTEEMESEPAWSPDGTKIAYQRGDESMGASIWLMNADGTGKTAVTTAVTWSDRDPAVAWDAETETISIVYESTFDAVPAANLSITKTGAPA